MRNFISVASISVSIFVGAVCLRSATGSSAVPTELAAQESSVAVTRFVFAYQDPEDGKGRDGSLPDLTVFEKLEVPLKSVSGQMAALLPGEKGSEKVRLGGDGKARRFGASAIVAVSRAVVSKLNQQGIYGVLVVVDPGQIDLGVSPLVENRLAGQGELRMLVYYSRVAKLDFLRRTGAGPAWLFPAESVGKRIAAQSPLQPGALLRKDALQNYLDRVNRYSGRRAESVLAPGEASGTLNLTLLEQEQKRLSASVLTSNSGNKESGEWRSRLGVELRQAWGADDVETLDYTTSDFEKYKSVSIASESTLVFPDIWKLRVYGSYSDLSLADLGQLGLGFRSTSQTLGVQSTWTPDLGKSWPLSITGGAYVLDAAVRNDVAGQEGSSTFLVPYVSVAAEKPGRLGRLSGSFQTEYAATEDRDNAILGRVNPAEEALVSRWNVMFSRRAVKFLDLFSAKKAALGGAHELALNMRGQVAWDQARLVPQFQGVAGGMDSVRGYRESLAAGDTVSFATAEYRLRLNDFLRGRWAREAAARQKEAQSETDSEMRVPRGVGVESDRAAARGQSRAGWFVGKGLPVEVALRGFVDGAQVHVNQAKPGFGEVGDRSLVGAGVGMDMVFRGKLNGMLRTDLGCALNEQNQPGLPQVKAGSSRLHVSVLMLW